MVQGTWLDRGPGQAGLLVVVVHHLVVDGVSWRVLLPDLEAAWMAVVAGRQPVLDPVGTSFRRWSQLLAEAAGQDQAAAELAWWQQVLDAGIRCWDHGRWARRTRLRGCGGCRCRSRRIWRGR